MTAVIKQWRQQGMSELACQFARFIYAKEKHTPSLVALTAALVSEAVSEGHVCLNLHALPSTCQPYVDDLPSPAVWRETLLASETVGQPGAYTPLILTDDNLVYLYQYYCDERDVAQQLYQRLKFIDVDTKVMQQLWQQWPDDDDAINWQKVAVAMAMSRQFAVISGGPGTGKTTIVRHILQCIRQQDSGCRIALAAPTGKAATRLQQSLGNAFTLGVKTLHRLLGISEQQEQGRYHAGRPLAIDLLIIDEASMIDIGLMGKVVRALPPKARLILLGDSQQLASVESGAVLANLANSPQGEFSPTFCELYPTLGLTASATTATPPLNDSFVRLQRSYRFADTSLIGQLAKQVNQGNSEAVIRLMSECEQPIWVNNSRAQQAEQLLMGYQAFIDAVEQPQPVINIIQAFEQFRVLAALTEGPQSVAAVNQLMTQLLAARGWRSHQQFYAGRPIMISRNNYRQQLFNGDTGVILPNERGDLSACFLFEDQLRWVDLNRLPAHETAFAMTIHKSQGSEFDGVSILLPESISPVLNRELLYTAITRARYRLSVLSNHSVLTHTIQTRHYRESGLYQQLLQLMT